MSKVLLLNGSARPKGATANALRLIGQELNERGVETTWFDSPVGHDEKGINTLKELAVNMSKML